MISRSSMITKTNLRHGLESIERLLGIDEPSDEGVEPFVEVLSLMQRLFQLVFLLGRTSVDQIPSLLQVIHLIGQRRTILLGRRGRG